MVARLRGLMLLWLGLLAAPAWADALPPPVASFSASQNLTVDGAALSARIFHAGGLERRESKVDGLNNLLILRPDRREAIVVQPESAVGMKLSLNDPEVGVVATNLSRLTGTVAGREIVAGEPTVKYRVQDVSPDGDSFDGHIWVTGDGIYIRVEGKVGEGERPAQVGMILSDIRRGAQDPSLFEPPPGLTWMSLDPLPGRVPPAFQPKRGDGP